MNKNILVIIPTYNAKEGIAQTIKNVLKKVPQANVLVVDDNSPDKTADLVKTTFKKNKNVQVLLRKGKGGRGSAVIAGFKEGLKNKDINYFVEMDADLCHDPKYILPMIEKSKSADVVIVSKYLKGSTIKDNWKRKSISKIMNFVTRIILQVPISDYSNGFRCYKREVISYLVKQHFTSKGFVVLSETIYKVHKKGFVITEIPFDFKREEISKSNLTLNEVFETVKTLLVLRFT